MERQAKRRRISFSPEIESPIPRSRYDAARKDVRVRLRTKLEAIFDKYGKDFSGIGDEIDLKTGEIVVDNGHLLGMKHEMDIETTARVSDPWAQNSDDEDGEHGGYISTEGLDPNMDQALDDDDNEEDNVLGASGSVTTTPNPQQEFES